MRSPTQSLARASRITAFAAVFLIGACAPDREPTSPSDDTPDLASGTAAQGGELPSAAQFARQVPGFGGFYLNADGTPTVYLTRGSSRAPAERILSGYLSAKGLSTAAVHVLEAQYSWGQLQRWQHAATLAAFEFTGTVFVDNDETTNRVLIGVEDPGAAGQIRAALARSGVPDAAVRIERADPIVQVVTLQNVVDRPVRGGVQINFPGYLCSVGFNATDGTQKSFITASHCTNKQGGVESTPYWQPLESTQPVRVAVEVEDPVYTKGVLPGCPRGKICRYSDASRAAYDVGTNQAFGLIARTSGANIGGPTALDIVGSFSISTDDCSSLGGCLPVGATVNKVGRTTGWTAGSITNTNVNTGVQGSRVVQLRQTFVSAKVGGGDSGSNVFQLVSSTNVKLAGVLWGGNGAGTQFVYSPFGNVVEELGPLATH
jgi:hypothetical protein